MQLKLLHLWEYLNNCSVLTKSATFPGKSKTLLNKLSKSKTQSVFAIAMLQESNEYILQN